MKTKKAPPQQQGGGVQVKERKAPKAPKTSGGGGLGGKSLLGRKAQSNSLPEQPTQQAQQPTQQAIPQPPKVNLPKVDKQVSQQTQQTAQVTQQPKKSAPLAPKKRVEPVHEAPVKKESKFGKKNNEPKEKKEKKAPKAPKKAPKQSRSNKGEAKAGKVGMFNKVALAETEAMSLKTMDIIKDSESKLAFTPSFISDFSQDKTKSMIDLSEVVSAPLPVMQEEEISIKPPEELNFFSTPSQPIETAPIAQEDIQVPQFEIPTSLPEQPVAEEIIEEFEIPVQAPMAEVTEEERNLLIGQEPIEVEVQPVVEVDEEPDFELEDETDEETIELEDEDTIELEEENDELVDEKEEDDELDMDDFNLEDEKPQDKSLAEQEMLDGDLQAAPTVPIVEIPEVPQFQFGVDDEDKVTEEDLAFLKQDVEEITNASEIAETAINEGLAETSIPETSLIPDTTQEQVVSLQTESIIPPVDNSLPEEEPDLELGGVIIPPDLQNRKTFNIGVERYNVEQKAKPELDGGVFEEDKNKDIASSILNEISKKDASEIKGYDAMNRYLGGV